MHVSLTNFHSCPWSTDEAKKTASCSTVTLDLLCDCETSCWICKPPSLSDSHAASLFKIAAVDARWHSSTSPAKCISPHFFTCVEYTVIELNTARTESAVSMSNRHNEDNTSTAACGITSTYATCRGQKYRPTGTSLDINTFTRN